ncbi:M23 family metallopeptidase [Nigerium massiliense]|uniref:M23 family metallopeptidase n=1 Tax=Nigerium massiliense TaxID=1522317 RepID=UPI0006944CBA|nr:M23 family metallopeptidase [Nigerium massiliense]
MGHEHSNSTTPARRVRVALLGLTAAAVVGASGLVTPSVSPAARASGLQFADSPATAASAGPGAELNRVAALNQPVAERPAPAAELTASDMTDALAAREAELSSRSTQIKAEAERQAKAGVFLRPTAGELGSTYGPRRHPILGYVRLHAGWDIGGTCGQPIYAALPGTVTIATQAGQSGNYLRVDHGTVNGHKLETSYQHMQGFAVKAGQKVARGQALGSVGNTGLSTACHLHFGVIKDGANADPAGYLKG